MNRATSTLVAAFALTGLATSASAAPIYSQDFDGLSTGSLATAQDGWEDNSTGTTSADATIFDQGGGNHAVRLEVDGTGQGDRSRLFLDLANSGLGGGINIAAYSTIEIEFDLTLDAAPRQNIYFDHDTTQSNYHPYNTINDGGNISLLETQPLHGTNTAPGGGGLVTLRWEYNVTAGTVNTFVNGNAHDTGVSESLDIMAEGGTLNGFTLQVATDCAACGTGTVGIVLDNYSITGTPIPEPGSLALLGLGGLATLRRRRK